MTRALIVENSKTFREELIKLLASRFPHMIFEEAEDGKEALNKFNNFLPDLIFMDIKLPGESGLALTSEIKKSHPDILILIVSSYDLPEYREAATRSGADYFVSKGASSAEEILTLVEAILPTSSSKAV